MRRIEIDDAVLKQLFGAGVPLAEIAEHFGFSRPLVARAVRRLGLSRQRPKPFRDKPNPRRIQLDEDEVERLFFERVPLMKMAEFFGCGRTRVAETIKRLGLTRTPPPRGRRREASAHWRGGRRISQGGYIRILVDTDCPGADAYGHIFEHRLVMQEALGRPLREDEVVHHINGVKTDNRIENLVVMTRGEHSDLHQELRRRRVRSCRWKQPAAPAEACEAGRC